MTSQARFGKAEYLLQVSFRVIVPGAFDQLQACKNSGQPEDDMWKDPGGRWGERRYHSKVSDPGTYLELHA